MGHYIRKSCSLIFLAYITLLCSEFLRPSNVWANGGIPSQNTVTLSCDNGYDVYLNGILLGSGDNWLIAQTFILNFNHGENVLAVKGKDNNGKAALIAEVKANGNTIVTNADWKVSLTAATNWNKVGFNESNWANASSYGSSGVSPWNKSVAGLPENTTAKWIWSSNNDTEDTVYFRRKIFVDMTPNTTNLALNKSAQQSSVTHNGSANRAVDGSTDGAYYNGSVTHTASTVNPYWQVDLGATYSIGSIKIWNRTDVAMDRLKHYTVSVKNSANSPVWSVHKEIADGYPNPSIQFQTQGVSGRYVKIQLEGTGILSLAEVQVFGSAASVTPVVITAQPSNKTVTVGQTATFSVTAMGTPAPTFQWRKNGANIAGATSSNYSTSPVVVSDNNAIFSVVATNTAGSVTSVSAKLTVNPASSKRVIEAATALAQRLDFTRPGMEDLQIAVNSENHQAVLDLFRMRVVKKLRAMDYSHKDVGRSANRTRTADAEMLMGRMTPAQYQEKYGKNWNDDFSHIGSGNFQTLKNSGLMAPLGTPIQWLHENGLPGAYIGAWGGGGWSYNTSLVDAWWWSGKKEYSDKWFEISESYFSKFFTATNREKLNGNGFFGLHTGWRITNSFIPTLARIAKNLDLASKPPIRPNWLDSWPSDSAMEQLKMAGASIMGEVPKEHINTIPSISLAWIAIGATEETAQVLLDSYFDFDKYFFVNQTYEGVMGIATLATIFDGLKQASLLGTKVEAAIIKWSQRSFCKDGGCMEHDWGYSLGYLTEIQNTVKQYETLNTRAPWLNELKRNIPALNSFWGEVQTPQGLLPCVGNSKYGSKAPTFVNPQVSTYAEYSGYACLRTSGQPNDQLYMMFANSRRTSKGIGHMSPNTGSVHITAYGRDLIVPGGSPSYGLVPKDHHSKWEQPYFDQYAAEHSTLKNSTVIVNGLSQSFWNMGRFNDALVAAPNTPVQARWLSNNNFDFVESRWIGYDRRGNNSFAAPVEEYNSNLEHHRQVVFIKSAELWLFVDFMRNKNYTEGPDDLQTRLPAVLTPSPYTFTQIWNFAPPRNEVRHHFGFSNENVVLDASNKKVTTNDPNGANLDIRHFSGMPLRYTKYFGDKTNNKYLGWLVDGKGAMFNDAQGTPRVDLHVTWKQTSAEISSGNIIPLVTVIAPSRNTSSIITSASSRVEDSGQVAGCELTTNTKISITYLTSATPKWLTAGVISANAEMLVLVKSPGVSAQKGILVGCTSLKVNNQTVNISSKDFEFKLDNGSVSLVQKITIPQ